MGLNSNSVIKIVDLLCEGPIEGIVGDRKGIYLDESPLESSAGDELVRKDYVTYKHQVGGAEPGYLPQAKYRTSVVKEGPGEIGSDYREILSEDGSKVTSRDYGAGQKTFTVTNLDVDTVDLVFTIPRLFSTAQEGLVRGQLFDAQIFFDVFVQAEGSGGPFRRVQVSKVSDISEDFRLNAAGRVFYIEGISTTAYQYKISGIDLAGRGQGPWNIRVRKYPQDEYQGEIPHTRADAADVDQDIFRATFREFQDIEKDIPLKNGRANTLLWSSVIEHVNNRTAYRYSATVGMSISTEEFQSLPTRSYLVKGKKVPIPSNAVPREDGSLEFIGPFNGLVGENAWTTCPVCIFHDLLVRDRYGAGHFVNSNNLSWVDLYPLAQYANELIDGEPRFACNVAVSAQADAFQVLQDFASIFRGMMYWQSNIIQVTADHGNLDGTNVDPVHIFSNSNVVGGVFAYSGSSLKTRSTSIRVRYIDPDNFYKPNVLVIEDSALISKYGYQIKEVLAFGCTSKNQARRLGRWMMKAEELDANTVAFAVGLDGALVFPGQVFAIQDELRAATRLSGRISSSTTTSIVADQTITLPDGDNPTLMCVLSDGTVESRPIDVANTTGTTIAVTLAFSSAPLAQAIYSISTSDVNEQKFRCLSVADNNDGTFAVVAVEFNDSIYQAADAAEDLEFLDVTTVDEKPPAPVI